MRTILLLLSLLLVAFAVALPILVIMGGGKPDQLTNEYDREALRQRGGPIERRFYRGFLWLADHRPYVGIAGAVGLVCLFLTK